MTEDDVRSRFMPADGTTVSGRTICAYAAVFNRRAEIRDKDGHYIEVIDPGAFAEGLAARRHQIFSVYNHGRNLDYTPSAEHSVPYGTPDPDAMREDHHGWYTETRMNDGAEGDRLLAAARNKALKGMSFTGFFVRSSPPKPPGGYQPDAYGNLPVVHRQKIMPIEYGLTPIPAYPEAEVVGVRSQEDQMAEGRADVTMSGPEPYTRKPGENIQCPVCLKYNDDQAEYCDQCGSSLPGWGAPNQMPGLTGGPAAGTQPEAGNTVHCPDCGAWNETDAHFCDQCGHILPVSLVEAAKAAAGATSSSGRQPAGTERAMADWDEAASAPDDVPEGKPDHGRAIGRHRHDHPAHSGPDDNSDGVHGHVHRHYDDADHDHAHHTDETGRSGGILYAAELFDRAGNPKPYGDVEYGDPKNGKYPIDAEHVVAAWDYINKPENADKYPLNGVTLASVKARIKAAMHTHGHKTDEDSDSSSKSPATTSSSGRQPESQGTASRGAAEPPQARSATNDRTTQGGNTMPGETFTVEERLARQAEIQRRHAELDAEYNGAELPQALKAEWDQLTEEFDDHERAVNAQQLRSAQMQARAARQGGLPGADPGSGYDDQSARDNGHQQVSRRSGPALISSPRQLDGDIWDLSTARTAARSVDELPGIYRERALRTLEFARFPGEPSRKREEIQERVEGLLHRTDDPHGRVAQLMLSTGSEVYKRAFGKILVKGPMSLTSEEQLAMQRAFQIGTPPNFSSGSYPVPYQIDPTVTLTSNGVINALRQIARVEQIVGREWLGVTSPSIAVSRTSELAPTTDASPTMAQPGVAAERVQAFVPFSIEVEQDWNGLLAEISMMLADAKDIEEATSFLTGSGTAPAAMGIITGVGAAGSAAVGVNAAHAGTIAAQDVYDLEDAMPPRFRAQSVFLSSKTGYNNIRLAFTQFAASAGDVWVRPSQGTPPELLGYPAYENSIMTGTIGGQTIATPLLVQGDFKQFLIVDRIGMSVELVPHVFNQASTVAGTPGFPIGERGIYAMWRNNSAVLVPNAFRMLVSI